ncbi:cobyric acid synthase [Halapricum hydrolyticum]|uniref:Probable cobyric acid synthase n=1 Tax=Halapricum hydrolyticum TaxID=2979991 RepID=A0AAE3IFM2_9EURY|nr:cobyric acid synthase [Halapricum hydrolyticum]MCU4718491.1 cobyric acid synthase [Halapricum hydrolyticum]MCU4727490.1 cobyric acid synthase [Halapricum hydrolyticum]
MTTTLLVAGTASHVGKSTVVAGLCRRLASEGVDAAPFKAQTMSNNAHAAVCVGKDAAYGEIGVAQYVQARAAGVVPTTDHNPVLLKPRGDAESQVLIDGRPGGHVSAGDYYEHRWERAREAAVAAYERLAADHDVIVAEGAGSIAEINLQHRDLANVETARFGDAEILLVGDIERGGVFASLYGTLELLPEDVRDRVAGLVVNKFRGDRSLLADGIEELEARTGVPVLGVLPHDDPGLPEEDSLSLPAREGSAVRGGEDGVAESRAVTIAVPRLPRLSNATDLDPLARVPGVRVAIRSPDATLADADAVVLPGTKNTVDDLLALREAGFDERLRAFDGPIVGICGGYQLLGQELRGADREGTGEHENLRGFGLLPVVTRFGDEKTIRQVIRTVEGAGPIDGASGTATGYEIHAGETRVERPLPAPIGPDSAATEGVLGTYLHGVFHAESVREAFVEAVFECAGRERQGGDAESPSPFDRAAELVEGIDLRKAVDLERVENGSDRLRSPDQ